MENSKIWTTPASGGDDSRVPPTAPSRNNTENPYFVGVQSRFRRKYLNKTLFAILILIIIILLIGIIIIACYITKNNKVCETKECLRAASDLLQTIDRSIDPCEDFYQFSCGNWAEQHPRPDSSTSYDWFSEKQKKVLRGIREFLKTNISESEPLPVKQTKQMYSACMDTDTMDKLGLAPIIFYLKQYNLPIFPTILNITDTNYNNYQFDWIRSIVNIKKSYGVDVLIGFEILPDPTNQTVNRLAFGTPETESELPFNPSIDRRLREMKRRALEEDTDDETGVLKHYYSYIGEVISAMILYSKPEVNIEDIGVDILKCAKDIVNISKYIMQLTQDAENMTKTVDSDSLSDIINLYITELQNITDTVSPKKPFLIWENYLKLMFENTQNVTINYKDEKILTSKADLKYLELLTDYLTNLTITQIEMFIWWTVIEELVTHTTSNLRNLHNEYSLLFTNLESPTPRSIYCTGGVNQLMGMAVSYAYADTNFFTKTKPKVEKMIQNIRQAFNDLVKHTTWMDSETKKSTLEKSAAMKSLIGFPDWILNKEKMEEFYYGLVINETTHLDNMIGVLEWRYRHKLESLHEKNQFGWATSPTSVNAFHTFQANAITIPLAILQYPFYHLGLESLNYGAIGTILGHELTHGFDDSGRQFDKIGNLRQWWTNKTVAEYINRTTCFVNQYAGYYLTEISEYLNGELTLGENIADNGGLREAYYAYQIFKNENNPESFLPGLENYTHDQLFFMSFGNLWCETITPISSRWSLEDSHSPGRFRLKGVLSNSPEFSKAFNCKKGSGMYPNQERCRIW